MTRPRYTTLIIIAAGLASFFGVGAALAMQEWAQAGAIGFLGGIAIGSQMTIRQLSDTL